MQLEIEIEAIKRENDETKLKGLGLELANLKEKRNEIFSKWKAEKDVVDAVQNLKQEIEDFKNEIRKDVSNLYFDLQLVREEKTIIILKVTDVRKLPEEK
jgi:ATP-dependent Clp protease ATP-binding subunit ClpB